LNHGSLAIYLCTISYHFSSNPKKLNFSYFDIDLEIEDEKGYVEIKSLTNLKEEEVIAHINDYFFPPL
jgi:hypothetical protein